MATVLFLVGAPCWLDDEVRPGDEDAGLGAAGAGPEQPPATSEETNTATARPETDQRAMSHLLPELLLHNGLVATPELFPWRPGFRLALLIDDQALSSWRQHLERLEELDDGILFIWPQGLKRLTGCQCLA